jgi:hypothetical protein
MCAGYWGERPAADADDALRLHALQARMSLSVEEVMVRTLHPFPLRH